MTRPLLVLVVLSLPYSPVRADSVGDAVADASGRLVEQILPVLKKQNAKVVRVSRFDGPATASAGPEIQEKLAAALEAKGIGVDILDFDVEIRGRYEEQLVGDDPRRSIMTVLVTAQLFQSNGKPLLELTERGERKQAEASQSLHGSEAVPRLLGISGPIAHNLPEPDRSRELERNRDNPAFDVAGSVIRSAAGQPYAVELLVEIQEKFAPRRPELKTGRKLPFVPIDPEEVYAIRLINESEHEAAVNLTIDGISCFAFSETKPRPNFWVVPAGKSIVVRGWDKDRKTTYEFKVTEFPETAAAKLKIEPNDTIGQITAQFSACWTEDAQPPADEPKSRGTGFGDEIEDEKKTVKRFVGNVRDTIHVRYERPHG